jgi:hypothetical protein
MCVCSCSENTTSCQDHLALFLDIPPTSQARPSLQGALNHYMQSDVRELTCASCSGKHSKVVTAFTKLPRSEVLLSWFSLFSLLFAVFSVKPEIWCLFCWGMCAGFCSCKWSAIQFRWPYPRNWPVWSEFPSACPLRTTFRMMWWCLPCGYLRGKCYSDSHLNWYAYWQMCLLPIVIVTMTCTNHGLGQWRCFVWRICLCCGGPGTVQNSIAV